MLRAEVEELLASSFGELGEGAQPAAPGASLDRRSIIAALFDRSGERIVATRAYEDLGEHFSAPQERIDAARGGAVVWALADFEPPWGGRELLPLVLAPSSRAASWRLPDEIADHASRHSGVLLLAATPAHEDQLLVDACHALGMNGLETKVAMAAVRGDDVRMIARLAGVTANTAKEALGGAMRRVGVDRRAALVGRISLLALGVLPREQEAAWLCDIWGLSVRQARIAGLVANGVSRGGAAAALGLGPAVVRKELETIYQAFDVGNAAGLARKIAESHAIRWLTEVTAGDLGFHDDWSEPIAILSTEDGRSVSYSDYGPRGGRPTLVFHSATSSRPVARTLLRSLHNAGRRVIAIDRPGFGQSDDFRRSPQLPDRMLTAARDTVAVMDKLNVTHADIVSRHTPLAVRCHLLAPERFGVMVLVNPGLPPVADDQRSGLAGLTKTIFAANPWAIRQTIRAVAARMSVSQLANLLRTWMSDSPADREVAQRSELVRDYFRGVRMFGTGRVSGCVTELIDRLRAPLMDPLPFCDRWRILVGSSDILYNPDDMVSYWRHRLPGALTMHVPGAGRLLPYTHPDAIVQALDS
jgi:pimeloyl-ACP methyl ester carboxylesterase/DNA-binding CsgD family transcriptional regulator